MNTKTPRTETFVRGNKRLAELLSRPEIAAGVAEVEAGARKMDRLYAESLAKIRRAGDLTQVEVAEKLGVGQGAVSRLERRSDMLLSTLAEYLRATGAEQPRIVVTLDGIDVELDLDRLRERPIEVADEEKLIAGKSSSGSKGGRSADSGRFVKQSTAKKNRKTTIREPSKSKKK